MCLLVRLAALYQKRELTVPFGDDLNKHTVEVVFTMVELRDLCRMLAKIAGGA
jgi:hypothetical protein